MWPFKKKEEPVFRMIEFGDKELLAYSPEFQPVVDWINKYYIKRKRNKK